MLWSIIKNTTKKFHIVGSYDRDSRTLSNIIKKYVEIGNTIISDGRSGYNFLDSAESGYSHIEHIHHEGNFGYLLQSTSLIEAIWSIIKGKIKTVYHVIPKFLLMRFMKEIEYRYKIRNLKDFDKIKDILECYQLF